MEIESSHNDPASVDAKGADEQPLSTSVAQLETSSSRDLFGPLLLNQKSDAIKAWRKIEQAVALLTDERGMSVDHRIRPLVVALNALGFPTISSCEGHVDRPPFNPYVRIGEEPSPFEIQFEEQLDPLNSRLRSLPIPWSARARLFSLIGMGPLTVSSCAKINIPQALRDHKDLLEKIADAFRTSASEVCTSLPEYRSSLPAESLRQARNRRHLTRLDSLVSLFKQSARAGSDAAINVDYSDNLIIDITFSPLPDLHEQSYEQLKARQRHATDLAEFLARHFFENFAETSSSAQE